MKALISYLLFFIVCSDLIAQHDFGISLKCGYSKLWSKSDPDANYFYRLSGGAGGFYEYKWPKGYGIRIELTISQFHSKEKILGYGGYTVRLQGANYFCIPVGLSYSFGSFTIFGGSQFNLGPRHGGYWVYQEKFDGSTTTPYLQGWNTHIFHFGTKVGLNYQISKKFSMGVGYYQQLFDLFEPNFYWTSFDFGINYSIQRKKGQPANGD